MKPKAATKNQSKVAKWASDTFPKAERKAAFFDLLTSVGSLGVGAFLGRVLGSPAAYAGFVPLAIGAFSRQAWLMSLGVAMSASGTVAPIEEVSHKGLDMEGRMNTAKQRASHFLQLAKHNLYLSRPKTEDAKMFPPIPIFETPDILFGVSSELDFSRLDQLDDELVEMAASVRQTEENATPAEVPEITDAQIIDFADADPDFAAF